MDYSDINLAKQLKINADEINKVFLEESLNELVDRIKYLLIDASKIGVYRVTIYRNGKSDLEKELFANELFVRKAKELLESKENGFKVQIIHDEDDYNFSKMVVDFGDNLKYDEIAE